MPGGLSIRELFREYGVAVDESLKTLFDAAPPYALYGHLAYFMGFADESLRPEVVYGGKRFRSSICLMLADWFGKRDAALPVATSLELFHNFTLIHDDIVDQDTLRRGRKTVWHLWGIPHAINSGDAQALLSYEVLASNNKLSAEHILAIQSFLTLQYRMVIEGQYLDFMLTDAKLGDQVVSDDTYFEMIGRKTAALIAAATKAAGMVADLDAASQEALYQYGYNLGVAYQLCDDTVSIWGTESQTGKRAYGDVLERKKTLAVLYAAKQLSGTARERLLSLYNQEVEMGTDEAREAISLLDSVGTYEYMRELVERYANAAKEQVGNVPISNERKNTLVSVVDALLPDIQKAK